jgi:hypothetical protein
VSAFVSASVSVSVYDPKIVSDDVSETDDEDLARLTQSVRLSGTCRLEDGW